MARLLKLRYMGIPINILIPEITDYSTAFSYTTAESAKDGIFDGLEDTRLTFQVGYATGNSVLTYRDYYNLIYAFCPNNQNIYCEAPSDHTWDVDWPTPCGENKILIPPAVSGQNWVCPANGRYVEFSGVAASGTLKATVYSENGSRITPTSGTYTDGFSYIPGEIVTFGVDLEHWEEFRNATDFATVLNYAHCVSITNTWDGKVRAVNTNSNNNILRVIWELVRNINGEDDPTVDPEDESDDPYSDDDSPYDPSDTGGGDGEGDDPYDPGDPIPEPDVPNISIADSGLVTIYTPTAGQLAELAAYLWSNDFITSMVKDLYADALDVIISLGFVPFNVSHGGTREIKVGNRGTGILSNYPAANYHKFDAGTISLKTTLGAYIDYAPYTKGDIYIPFVGYVPLDIDAFMGHSISLKYICDLCTGSAVAILKKDNDVWQQFACNLLTQVPLSAANYAQMYQTIIGATAILAGAGIAGAAGIGGAAVGGEAAEGAQAIASQSGGAAKAASGIMSAAATKPQIQKSNNLSLSAGLLGNKKAFIQLYRPNLALPANQNKFQGYPSYIELTLSECSGYTRVSSCNLTIPGATGSELSMIDSILKTGFIVGSGSKPTGSGILLCQNKSPAHQVKKDITKIAELTGTFRDSVSVINPVIRIEYNDPVAFDYVYVSHFGRWYFVEDITMVRKNVMDVTLRVDVLETFADGILSNKAIIDKSANKYNLYLNDDSLKMYQKPLIQQIEFPNALFTQNEWVLIVSGS